MIAPYQPWAQPALTAMLGTYHGKGPFPFGGAGAGRCPWFIIYSYEVAPPPPRGQVRRGAHGVYGGAE